MRESLVCFLAMKESKNRSVRLRAQNNCDMIRKHRHKDAFPECKAEQRQSESKGETHKCTQTEGTSNPKKKNKTSSNEKEFKYLNTPFMHDHTLYDTLHQAYVLLSETGIQSEK